MRLILQTGPNEGISQVFSSRVKDIFSNFGKRRKRSPVPTFHQKDKTKTIEKFKEAVEKAKAIAQVLITLAG